jgi:uncharacterized cupin superfamily protein
MSDVPEARIVPFGAGHAPEGPGWFVLNAADAAWVDGFFGAYTRFENREKARFEHFGFNIGVLQPGQPACWYHGEDEQEDFLVLQGECLLIIEEQERRLKQWDMVHCPAWTEHVFVGAGDGPCALLAVGTRLNDDVIYPAGGTAHRHGAAAPQTTPDPAVAYADVPPDEPAPFQPGWLP